MSTWSLNYPRIVCYKGIQGGNGHTMTKCCPWCKDGLSSPYEPTDGIDAEKRLCRAHLAEYEGTSLDGLDREDAAMYADMTNLGIYD